MLSIDILPRMSPSRVIRSYLVISGLFTLSASLIWGINTLFLLDAGLSIFQVFVANAVFTAAMALFEIPTGVVADTRGRRASFLLSEAIICIGTLAYVGVAAIHGGLLLFCLAGVILGLGYTFYSGAVEAWLVDALKATGYERELDGVFARASIVSHVAMIIGTVGGGLLGTIDLSIPYLVRAGLILIAFAIGFRTMHDIGFEPRTMQMRGIVGEMRKVARAGLTYGWQKPAVRLLLMESFVTWGFFAWAWYAWQPYFLRAYGSNAIWVSGLIAAVFSLAGIAGNALVSRRREARTAPHDDPARGGGGDELDDGGDRRRPFVLGDGADLPARRRRRRRAVARAPDLPAPVDPVLGARDAGVVRLAGRQPRQRRRADRPGLPVAGALGAGRVRRRRPGHDPHAADLRPAARVARAGRHDPGR